MVFENVFPFVCFYFSCVNQKLLSRISSNYTKLKFLTIFETRKLTLQHFGNQLPLWPKIPIFFKSVNVNLFKNRGVGLCVI